MDRCAFARATEFWLNSRVALAMSVLISIYARSKAIIIIVMQERMKVSAQHDVVWVQFRPSCRRFQRL